MKKEANIGNSQTIPRKVFIHRLRHECKKSSLAELQLTLTIVSQEINKRQKKGKTKK